VYDSGTGPLNSRHRGPLRELMLYSVMRLYIVAAVCCIRLVMYDVSLSTHTHTHTYTHTNSFVSLRLTHSTHTYRYEIDSSPEFIPSPEEKHSHVRRVISALMI
jgi:hypothetical protein